MRCQCVTRFNYQNYFMKVDFVNVLALIFITVYFKLPIEEADANDEASESV